MVDLCLVRDERRLALVPATDLDSERVQRLPKAWPLDLRVHFSRTSKLNRWYRGLVARVAEGMGIAPEALHVDLKTKAGLIEQVILLSSKPGAIAIKLRSTAFPEMEDLEFSEYCDLAVRFICSDYLGHLKAKQQQKLILEWVGRRPKLEDPPKLVIPK